MKWLVLFALLAGQDTPAEKTIEDRISALKLTVDFQNTPLSKVVDHFRNVAGPAWRHIALAPDELEHRYYIVVVFVLVSHRQSMTTG
ncbi:MAG: hypothetical protein IIA12_04870 [Proteobacteria bacterium]|nr:hypothetical protein [Pseudomonadota bacterium]